MYMFESWGGGMVYFFYLHPVVRSQRLFPQGDCGQLRAVLLLISCSDISRTQLVSAFGSMYLTARLLMYSAIT